MSTGRARRRTSCSFCAFSSSVSGLSSSVDSSKSVWPLLVEWYCASAWLRKNSARRMGAVSYCHSAQTLRDVRTYCRIPSISGSTRHQRHYALAHSVLLRVANAQACKRRNAPSPQHPPPSRRPHPRRPSPPRSSRLRRRASRGSRACVHVACVSTYDLEPGASGVGRRAREETHAWGRPAFCVALSALVTLVSGKPMARRLSRSDMVAGGAGAEGERGGERCTDEGPQISKPSMLALLVGACLRAPGFRRAGARAGRQRGGADRASEQRAPERGGLPE